MVFKKGDWLKAIRAYDVEIDRWCLRWNKARTPPCFEIVRNDEKDPTLISDKRTITDAGQDNEAAEDQYDEKRKMAALGAALKALGIR